MITVSTPIKYILIFFLVGVVASLGVYGALQTNGLHLRAGVNAPKISPIDLEMMGVSDMCKGVDEFGCTSMTTAPTSETSYLADVDACIKSYCTEGPGYKAAVASIIRCDPEESVGDFLSPGYSKWCEFECKYINKDCCGNKFSEKGEKCDVGSAAPTASCREDCTVPKCGDEITDERSGEECDPGSRCDTPQDQKCQIDNDCANGLSTCSIVSDGKCDTKCKNIFCGDGKIEPLYEDCDDKGESATCDDDCTSVRCGDGKTNTTAKEECDDGSECADGSDCSDFACPNNGVCKQRVTNGCKSDCTMDMPESEDIPDTGGIPEIEPPCVFDIDCPNDSASCSTGVCIQGECNSQSSCIEPDICEEGKCVNPTDQGSSDDAMGAP